MIEETLGMQKITWTQLEILQNIIKYKIMRFCSDLQESNMQFYQCLKSQLMIPLF